MSFAYNLTRALVASNKKKSHLARHLGISSQAISQWYSSGTVPHVDRLKEIADFLGVTVSDLLFGDLDKKAHGAPSQLKPVPSSNVDYIPIKGSVQAGAWQSAVEWPPDEWEEISVPCDEAYNRFPRYALQVRGNSVNKEFPDGSIVVVVRYSDLGRWPAPGEMVVAVRRDPYSEAYEATLKLFDISEDGRVVLWPMSTDPEWQTPIILPSISSENRHDGFEGDTAGWPNVVIQAVVIASFRPQRKIKR